MFKKSSLYNSDHLPIVERVPFGTPPTGARSPRILVTKPQLSFARHATQTMSVYLWQLLETRLTPYPQIRFDGDKDEVFEIADRMTFFPGRAPRDLRLRS